MSLSLTAPRAGRGAGVIEIALAGVVGLSDASILKRTLKQIVETRCRALVIDLRWVVDIDAICWDRLVSAARSLRRQGACVVLWHCPALLFNQLQLRHWDRCFLLPEHNSQDRAALPADLREDLEVLQESDAGLEDTAHQAVQDTGSLDPGNGGGK